MSRIKNNTGDYPQLPIPDSALNGDGYPKNWPKIAVAVKDWAGWHCVPCGGMINIAVTAMILLPGTLSRFIIWFVIFDVPAWMFVRRLA